MSVIQVDRHIEPEPAQGYEPGGYHPVCADEVFHQYYRVVHQLGWGQMSTVWLVQDTRTQQFAALKILIADVTTDKAGWHELGMLRTLRDGDPCSPGRRHVYQLLDNFLEKGPNGTHICLVLEPMSVSVLDIRRAYSKCMPMPLVRRIARHVIQALHYVHECGIVHTDIKGDNILMAGQPLAMGEEGIQLSIDELMSATYKLTDFGTANKVSHRFADVIQPEKLRAPEVIIGAGWDTKADIWNYGCLIAEYVTGDTLFNLYHENAESGMNPVQTHLAQMVGLIGQFPRQLLDGGQDATHYFDDQGQLLQGAEKYTMTILDLLLLCGKYSPTDPDVYAAADFLSQALVIDPVERWSAGQLLDHPWLQE